MGRASVTTVPLQGKLQIFRKFVFVAVCCTTGAVVAASLHEAYHGVPAICLFGAITATAFWLGMRGKTSESWALLAYGSWMTIPCMLLLSLLWNNPVADGTDWGSCLLYAGAILLLAWGGIKAALRNDWTKVGSWWLFTLLPFFMLALLWFFAMEVQPQQQHSSFG